MNNAFTLGMLYNENVIEEKCKVGACEEDEETGSACPHSLALNDDSFVWLRKLERYARRIRSFEDLLNKNM